MNPSANHFSKIYARPKVFWLTRVRASRQTDRRLRKYLDSITEVFPIMERATCWSITINNPEEVEYKVELPAGWSLEGQLERGEEGTLHYQGMLKTPQVRFSAVKKVFPRGHIEVARNRKALEKYVNKVDTRVEKVEKNVSRSPTLFEYQGIIAGKWDVEGYAKYVQNFPNKSPDEVAMLYLDSLIAEDIEGGRRGAEYIAINPMWRASWKLFWRSIIIRHERFPTQGQEIEPSVSPPAEQESPEQVHGGSGVCVGETECEAW